MAKSIQSAVFGKLIPAIIKAYGSKVVGLNMNKVIHVMQKACHGLDMLDPSEIVYEVFKAVAKNVTGMTSVYLILATGQIVKITVQVMAGGCVKMGTAYVIEKIAEAIEEVC